MRKISLIIYDFDGTLVDTLFDIADTVNLSLVDLGLPQFIGMPTSKLGNRCAPIADAIERRPDLCRTVVPTAMSYYRVGTSGGRCWCPRGEQVRGT